MERLPDALERALQGYETYLAGATRFSPRTKKDYAYWVRTFLLWAGAQSMDDISPQTLLDWQQALREAGNRASTINIKHSSLKSLFRYQEDFLEDEHSARLLKMLRRMDIPKDEEPSRETYAIAQQTLRKLLDAVSEGYGTTIRNKALIHFLWATGARRAELINLTMDKLDMEERMAQVTGKGDKDRIVVFDEACAEDLRIWIETARPQMAKCDNVFVSIQGGPLTGNAVGFLLRDTCRRSGIGDEIWTHLFRHSAITRLLDGGMNIQDVAVIAGHASVNTTMKYFHAEPGKLKEAYDLATAGKA